MPDLEIKSIAKDKIKVSLYHDSGIAFDRYQNDEAESMMYDTTMKKDRIHFFFGIENKIKLHFGPYVRTVDEQAVTFLYNPLQEHSFQFSPLSPPAASAWPNFPDRAAQFSPSKKAHPLLAPPP